MKKLFPHIKSILPGLLLTALAATSQAGSIQLTPVRVNLAETARVAVVTVHNTGDEDAVMQVTLNKWRLNGQDYSYEQSQELVVTPATFRLAPGSQQVVRIGLRSSPPKDKEDAYRLLIEEVPPPATPAVTGTRFIVRHDLPVFVAPLQAARPLLDISVACTAQGGSLRLVNTGNIHMQVRNVALLKPNTSNVLWSQEAADYLLPDAQKSWTVAPIARLGAGDIFQVNTLTDQGSFTANVKNECP